MQIVLARLDSDFIIEKYGRTDLGEHHKYKEIKKPVSLMWLNNGTKEDIKKAKQYAEKEGYKIFTYNNEKDPLQKAREDIRK
ncbi:MAG: hypothetical protein WDA59_10865 [Methanofastidiosum sp.]